MSTLTPTVLDVSEYEAPEPMRLILQSLPKLQPGQLLLVKHRKEPTLLYPKLIEAGFRFITIELKSTTASQFEIGICYECDLEALQQYFKSSKT